MGNYDGIQVYQPSREHKLYIKKWWRMQEGLTFLSGMIFGAIVPFVVWMLLLAPA